MAQLQDIPTLIREFIELARQYLLQETVEPAKKLGYFAGMSLAAASLWAFGLILISVAGLRSFIGVMPDGPYWQALTYVIVALLLVGFCALVVKLVPTRGVHDGPDRPEEVAP